MASAPGSPSAIVPLDNISSAPGSARGLFDDGSEEKNSA
ncbi:hypothetical protein Esi_0025_0085 [Ectocarpus siliculosus]|uniref:Uncharacterized protein n=1 Tax=Ectocarpus siliculosus TaxID=2880 RepID=D7FTG2_ECTSI|nr:hypothetical protein Esi_0025_0085 [Ectocarpus siliculosus]|eukprot:CBJ48540.1 hypothetical protein Esi_0025_0085 [Ectocarpus siliculosus]